MQEGCCRKRERENLVKPRNLIYGGDLSPIGYSGKFLKHSLAHEPGPTHFIIQLCANLAHIPGR